MRFEASQEGRRPFQWGDAAILAGLAVFALHPADGARPVVGAAGIALILLPLLRLRGIDPAAAMMTGGLCAFAGLASQWFFWPLYLLVPILGFLAAGEILRQRRPFLASARPGRFGKGEAALVLLISVAAGLALSAWALLWNPDLSGFRAMLPRWSVPALIGAGLAFSVVNAILEEFIWRGVFQRWLTTFAGGGGAVVLQALSFGVAHYIGFPGGFVGAGLATIYGLMLGALALRSGGLLAPLVAHVLADAVIFALVASSASAG